MHRLISHAELIARTRLTIQRVRTQHAAASTAPRVCTRNRDIILVFRGHVRDAFETDELRAWTDGVSALGRTLRICAHAWPVRSSSRSWRVVPADNRRVEEATIRAYFGDARVARASVESSARERVSRARANERVGCTQAYLDAWCSYWESSARALALAAQLPGSDGALVVSCRYDVFDNPVARRCDMTPARASELVRRAIHAAPNTAPTFAYPEFVPGYDNIYAGSLASLQRLVRAFDGPARIRARAAACLTVYQEELVHAYVAKAWPASTSRARR